MGSLAYADLDLGDAIGQGGNAVVYEATADVDGETHRIAVKQPRLEGTVHGETVERFEAEAETWSKLDGADAVVGVVDWGTEPVPWIAMEYMDGGSLGDRAESTTVEQALWTALRIVDAVYHAHRNGVAHLDLKPANVLFRETDGWAAPKVADWGLAKQTLHHSGSVDGFSAQYAAPEQLDDEFGTPGQASDVYGLGAVCYELFTGEPPFDGSIGSVITDVLRTEPTPPSAVAPDLPAAVDDVVTTAMAKRPGDRYEDVLRMRDDLQELFDERT